MTEDEIKQMLKDAEANAEADAKRKELIEVKNHAETLLNSSEQGVKEYGDKISAEEKSKIESDIAALKEACNGEDADDIRTKTQNLIQSSMKIGDMMYKDTQSGQTESGEQQSSENKEEVVDGDYKDLNK